MKTETVKADRVNAGMARVSLYKRLQATPGGEQRFRDSYAAGVPVQDMAVEYGVSAQSVHYLAVKLGLPTRTGGVRKVYRPVAEQVAEITQSPRRRAAFTQNYNSGQPVDVIAGTLGVSKATVRLIARQLGLPPRQIVTPTKSCKRSCLCCSKMFDSAGAHNRLCQICSNAAASLPDQFAV